MSGTGDLRAVLADPQRGYGVDAILVTLAAADEPLTAAVECRNFTGSIGHHVCPKCDGTRTVRIVALTEDVLRERLRDPSLDYLKLHDREIDAIVRAILGGDE